MIVALCIFNILDVNVGVGDAPAGSDRGSGRRSLLSSLYLAGTSTLMPWAEHHLVGVTDRPDPTQETALFWRECESSSCAALALALAALTHPYPVQLTP